MTLPRLFLLLTILPLIELGLLLLMGRYISIWFTLAFVVFTALAGSILLRYQGIQTFRNIQRDLNERRMPTDSLLDGLFIFIAAILLILPGVTTDLNVSYYAAPESLRGWEWRHARARIDDSSGRLPWDGGAPSSWSCGCYPGRGPRERSSGWSSWGGSPPLGSRLTPSSGSSTRWSSPPSAPGSSSG